jgi:hypothetical protein
LRLLQRYPAKPREHLTNDKSAVLEPKKEPIRIEETIDLDAVDVCLLPAEEPAKVPAKSAPKKKKARRKRAKKTPAKKPA